MCKWVAQSGEVGRRESPRTFGGQMENGPARKSWKRVRVREDVLPSSGALLTWSSFVWACPAKMFPHVSATTTHLLLKSLVFLSLLTQVLLKCLTGLLPCGLEIHLVEVHISVSSRDEERVILYVLSGAGSHREIYQRQPGSWSHLSLLHSCGCRFFLFQKDRSDSPHLDPVFEPLCHDTVFSKWDLHQCLSSDLHSRSRQLEDVPSSTPHLGTPSASPAPLQCLLASSFVGEQIICNRMK